jgi:hypothetical protein
MARAFWSLVVKIELSHWKSCYTSALASQNFWLAESGLPIWPFFAMVILVFWIIECLISWYFTLKFWSHWNSIITTPSMVTLSSCFMFVAYFLNTKVYFGLIFCVSIRWLCYSLTVLSISLLSSVVTTCL